MPRHHGGGPRPFPSFSEASLPPHGDRLNPNGTYLPLARMRRAMGPNREDRPALSDTQGDDGDPGAGPPPARTVPRVGGQHRPDRGDRTRTDWRGDSGSLHDERERERPAREDHGQLHEDETEVADGRVRGERETGTRRATVDSAGTRRGATSRSVMITGAAPF